MEVTDSHCIYCSTPSYHVESHTSQLVHVSFAVEAAENDDESFAKESLADHKAREHGGAKVAIGWALLHHDVDGEDGEDGGGGAWDVSVASVPHMAPYPHQGEAPLRSKLKTSPSYCSDSLVVGGDDVGAFLKVSSAEALSFLLF